MIRELRALGIEVQQPNIQEHTDIIQNNNNTMATATTAIQINLFHNVIDLTSTEGKKLYQETIQGLPED